MKDARIYFTRAAEIQSNSMSESRRHKRAIALLGLWACCKLDDDGANALNALKKIDEISREPSVGLAARYGASSSYVLGGSLSSTWKSLTGKITYGDLIKYDADFKSIWNIKTAVRKKLRLINQAAKQKQNKSVNRSTQSRGN